MTSMREERWAERVAEIRPQLAKARELAEKADSEHREMTAEEKADYDEIMTKGRAVADAVAAHRHDQSVWEFARELSDSVTGGLDGGGLSGSPPPSQARRLGFKGLCAQVAATMMP